jgi:hypothetical protein
MLKSIFTPAARFVLATAAALAVTACGDPTTLPVAASPPALSAVRFWEAGSTLSWNQIARELIASRNVTNVATQSRILAYLSVAQYNAIVTAEEAKDGGDHASPAAAAAGASVVVLKSFFPSDWMMLDARMLAQRSAERWAGEQHTDFAAGEHIGRAIGAHVLAYAATDRVNLTAPPANPGGPGTWTGTNSVRANYGARTFALTSGDQFRPGPPPAFGSAEFNADLAETKALTLEERPEYLAIANLWAPRGPAYMNGVAAEMIVAHRRSEREAARILALANMAGFDVLSACFDAKFAYYLIRPVQADPAVKLAFTMPNHPSYPSGHSCITAAYGTVLASAFPEESDRVEGMIEQAGLSRMYAGLHYRFDCIVGQDLGRNVAMYVLSVAPRGREVIPLD